MASRAPIHNLHSSIGYSAVTSSVLKCFAPSVSCRYASGLSKTSSKALAQGKKKKKQRSEYKNQTLRDAVQFSLCDAMRYVFRLSV